MINFFVIIASIISVSLIFLGYLVLKKKKNDLTNISFFLLSFFGAIWLIFSFLENIVYSRHLAEIFLRLDFLTGILAIFAVFIFLFNFPTKNKKFNKLVPFFLLLIIVVSVFSFSDLLLYDVVIGSNGIAFSEGPLFLVYALILLIAVLSGLINQFIQYRKLRGVARMQIKYVLIGFLIIALLTAFNLTMQNSVPLFVFRLINFSPIFLFLSIFYAIIRYRLLDIRYVLRLSTIFSFLLFFVVTIYATLSYLFSNLAGLDGFWLYIIPSLMIVIFFEKIKYLVAELSDKVLFQKGYDFSEIASKINHEIRSSKLDLQYSLSEVDKIVAGALKVSSSALLVINDQGSFSKVHDLNNKISLIKIEKKSIFVKYFERYPGEILDKDELLADFGRINEDEISRQEIIVEMEKRGITLLLGIIFEKRLVGFYALGEKMSKDYFRNEDFSLIKHAVWQIAWLINSNFIYESLKKIDKEKSGLISVISHQFKSPLVASRLNLELCLDPSLTKDDMFKSLQEVYKSILTMDNYLNQLLLVLEMENTGFSLKKDNIFSSEFIDPVLISEAKNIADKKIKLNQTIFDENFIFSADKNKISKVFQIILTNAIKYSFPEGEILISCEKKYLSGIESLVFSVTDNGIGLDNDSLRNISKKFFRAKQAISYSPDGFGLNLFIAKKIIEAHGGALWFEKGKKAGSVFYFSIPLEK